MNNVHCTVLLVVAWLTSGVLSTPTPIIGLYHCPGLLVEAWLTSGVLSTQTPIIGRSCSLHSSTRCSLINQWSPLNSNSCYRSVHVHCTFLLAT